MALITDRDLLLIEPGVFTAAAVAATNLLTVTDGDVSGTTLTSASSDFATLEIDEGNVALVDDEALEIVQRVSATELDVSRPRRTETDEKIAPESGTGRTLRINSFARLIDQTQGDLLQALGMHADDPRQPLDAGDIVNPQPLANMLALRVIARAFGLAAALDGDNASLAARAALFAERADEAAASTAVLLDLDGDGEADATRFAQVAVLRRS
jgi:hypothetical protein